MSMQIFVTFRGFELNERFQQTGNLADTWAHFRVALDPIDPQTVDQCPQLAQKLIKKFPRFRIHSCDNGNYKSFPAELEKTEIAHAFEHVMIELLAHESNLSRLDIKGQTAWNFSKDGHGVYRVRIQGFTSEEQARRISQQACVVFQDLSR